MASRVRLAVRITLGVAVSCLTGFPATAEPIDWVTVGDPGNTADTVGAPNPAGAVADAFRIMKFEFTNQQYVDFLNSVAATDTYSLYNTNMGSNARGGITQGGTPGSYTYAVRANMGDKPVNFVSWFSAARVANWLQNGATSASSTETGAYTLSGGTSGNAPAVNPGASFYLPTQDQWYKAAYYKGGGTNAGYWVYATQSDTTPTAVNATTIGTGTSGGLSPVTSGNFINYNSAASWNGQSGNVTTVGTNGGPSAYGAFDMGGNVGEWNDMDGTTGSQRVVRGGAWNLGPFRNSATRFDTSAPTLADYNIGFRLASPVPVPEPSTYAMALAGIACGGFAMWRRRKRA